ncbi:hypothetical protein BX666DRAFT_1990983 [Dichotomocladium elegans]|nr:hypothetical protein BX666DRAFT_1990983 [Dichotomocladium elegans]
MAIVSDTFLFSRPCRKYSTYQADLTLISAFRLALICYTATVNTLIILSNRHSRHFAPVLRLQLGLFPSPCALTNLCR